jgi:tetraacyldisaccharide 4'-kinase
VIRTRSNYPRYLRSPVARLAATAAEPFYRAALSMRNAAFDRGWRKTHRVNLPVISIGNLTTGGTGKTPTIVYVAHTLQAYGACPAVVLRGYMPDSAAESDEQELLRDLLPDTPVIADPDRVAAVRRLEWEHAEVDVVLLDDGFQHRRLKRDLDIVLIDATNPFGYDHVLPRGLMRESPAGLRRADAVVLTHADLLEPSVLSTIGERVRALHGRPPIAHTAHAWSQIVDADDQPVERPRARVFIVAGIGNPDSFLDQAAQRFTIVGTKLLPDHANYDRQVLGEVRRELDSAQPEAILTTEKDWVKLRRLLKSNLLPAAIWRPRLCIAFLHGEKEFSRLLLSVIKKPEGPAASIRT